MTAFRPIPARQAADMIEAASIPDARRLLVDSAAADLVKAYALVTEIIGRQGQPEILRGNAVPVEVWRRIVKEGVAEDLWSGGTVRLRGSDLIGGAPEINVTTVSFNEKHLRRLIHNHSAMPAVPPSSPPAQPKHPTVAQRIAPAELEAPVATPAADPGKRQPDPSAIPPGALTVTFKQAMAATGLGRTTLDKLCNAGDLARVKVGGRALITTESIRKLLDLATG